MYDYEGIFTIQTVAEKLAEQTATQLDDSFFKCMQKYEIDCDKERLIKALEYDSDQYDKGFRDGVKTIREIGHWLVNIDDKMFECSVCDGASEEDFPYCQWCGAYMEGEKE